MADVPVCERRLDVPLRLADGGGINLAHFCGPKLIVLFYPAGVPHAAHEVEAFEALLPEFERSGVWLVSVIEGAGQEAPAPGTASPINIGVDPDGSAFRALSRASPEMNFDPGEGATFLIDRDGVVHHAWQSVAPAQEVLARAIQRP